MPSIFEKIDTTILPLYQHLYRALLFFCKVLLVCVILITTYSVVGRYINGIQNPAWTEEMVLTGMAYIAMLSGALAINQRTHIRMTAFDHLLPRKVILCLDVLADLAVMILAIVMLSFGWTFANNMSFATYTSLPNLSLFWRYFAIPLAGLFLIVFLLESLYKNIRAFYEQPEKESV